MPISFPAIFRQSVLFNHRNWNSELRELIMYENRNKASVAIVFSHLEKDTVQDDRAHCYCASLLRT